MKSKLDGVPSMNHSLGHLPSLNGCEVSEYKMSVNTVKPEVSSLGFNGPRAQRTEETDGSSLARAFHLAGVDRGRAIEALRKAERRDAARLGFLETR